MKKFLMMTVVALGIFLTLPVAATQAQDNPKLTMFGGYSFLSSGYFSDGWTGGPRQNLQGYTLQGTWNLNPHIGITGDFSGHNGTMKSNFWGISEQDQYFFVFGPTFTQKVDKVSIFAHTLAGLTHSHVFASGDDPRKNTDFAMTLGGGLDYQVSPHWGYRIMQIDYIMAQVKDPFSTAGPFSAHHVRVSTGVTWNW